MAGELFSKLIADINNQYKDIEMFPEGDEQFEELIEVIDGLNLAEEVLELSADKREA
ncbi:hypothetical protein [uncultured Amphritea sp.]|uniref:hypothetical protein n=1 Tax=uncultured Amphritea sp. TaxID=981605 RepID=UPI002603DD28|nr:hypothetical protein [uncultured Amphritea sp.]